MTLSHSEPTPIRRGGTVPAAAKRLEHILREARRLDAELLAFFGEVAEVRAELTEVGAAVELLYPPLVDAAAEVHAALTLADEAARKAAAG